MRHNELREGVVDLTDKAYTPSYVRDDLLILSGCAVKMTKATPDGDSVTTDQTRVPPPEVTEQKRNLLIRDILQNGMDSVCDMRFLNTDAKSHMDKAPGKCLQEAERGKKCVYLASVFKNECRKHCPSHSARGHGSVGCASAL